MAERNPPKDPVDVFSDPKFLERFIARRNNPESLNRCIDLPCVADMLGPVDDKDILELGCGTGQLANLLASRGARKVFAIDASAELVRQAKSNQTSDSVEVIQADITSFTYPQEEFDIVVSSLTLHFIEDISMLLAKIFETLRPGGRLVISIRHPMRTSNPDGETVVGKEMAWLVHAYAQDGARVHDWLGQRINIHHRKVETWVRALIDCGFNIVKVDEPSITEQHDGYEDNSHLAKEAVSVPPFLAFEALKPA